LDESRILTSAIRGFVLTIYIPLSSAPIRSAKSGLPSSLTLISRLSCRRAGTRFNSRGIDDDGNVSLGSPLQFLITIKYYDFHQQLTFDMALI
jgi:synaptojanin